MNSTSHEKELDWLHPLKKRIFTGLLGILTICIAVTMIFIVFSLRSRLIADNRLKTQELGSAIESALSALMQARNPDMIQQTVDSIRGNGSINIQITASIGVASCPENATTIRDLILSADRALYAAKHAGKDRVVVSELKAAF